MITIIDYGMGNLGSVLNMFKRIQVPAEISGDPEIIARATKLLLPGVGAFDNAMARINAGPVRPILERKALVERIPILGICLGMQLLTRSSEEGVSQGLGWVAASTRRFPDAPGLKVPHMGWTSVSPGRPSALTRGLPAESRFYFVHSYYVTVDDEQDSVLTAVHGTPFDAAIQHGNIYGAQFHPEKSHRFGMQLLANFATL